MYIDKLSLVVFDKLENLFPIRACNDELTPFLKYFYVAIQKIQRGLLTPSQNTFKFVVGITSEISKVNLDLVGKFFNVA